MKSFNFCNNCGKSGHIFQSCNEPITSVGVIAYRNSENTNNHESIEYLMICRKDTLGYLDFIRGRYNLQNIEYIKTIIDIMTVDEKNRIINNDFDYLWNNLWGENIGIQYRGEEKNAKLKFNQLRKGIYINNNYITIKSLIQNSNTCGKNQWGFQKVGVIIKKKRHILCIREFTEETGYVGSCII